VTPTFFSLYHPAITTPPLASNPQLAAQTGDAEKRHLDELKQLRELAFVITDLEASTAIAAAAPRQFEKVQEMHDSLMRELIVRYQG
jgi:crotonobetainyl-CoA:carnitine CoA-transferase CaiB-like acyl-CoA transferase